MGKAVKRGYQEIERTLHFGAAASFQGGTAGNVLCMPEFDGDDCAPLAMLFVVSNGSITESDVLLASYHKVGRACTLGFME